MGWVGMEISRRVLLTSLCTTKTAAWNLKNLKAYLQEIHIGAAKFWQCRDSFLHEICSKNPIQCSKVKPRPLKNFLQVMQPHFWQLRICPTFRECQLNHNHQGWKKTFFKAVPETEYFQETVKDPTAAKNWSNQNIPGWRKVKYKLTKALTFTHFARPCHLRNNKYLVSCPDSTELPFNERRHYS